MLLVTMIEPVNRGSILVSCPIMNLGMVSSFDDSLILIVYPQISTQSRSWKPTKGMLPAMIVATCLFVQLFLISYCEAHFSKFCSFKSRHIPFSACRMFSFVNQGFLIPAVLQTANSSSERPFIISEINSPRCANARILSLSVMDSRNMRLGDCKSTSKFMFYEKITAQIEMQRAIFFLLGWTCCLR